MCRIHISISLDGVLQSNATAPMTLFGEKMPMMQECNCLHEIYRGIFTYKRELRDKCKIYIIAC